MITEARFQWGLRRAEDLVSRGNGIRLVQQVYYFDRAQRLGGYALLRSFPSVRYGFSIVAYQFERVGREN